MRTRPIKLKQDKALLKIPQKTSINRWGRKGGRHGHGITSFSLSYAPIKSISWREHRKPIKNLT